MRGLAVLVSGIGALAAAFAFAVSFDPDSPYRHPLSFVWHAGPVFTNVGLIVLYTAVLVAAIVMRRFAAWRRWCVALIVLFVCWALLPGVHLHMSREEAVQTASLWLAVFVATFSFVVAAASELLRLRGSRHA